LVLLETRNNREIGDNVAETETDSPRSNAGNSPDDGRIAPSNRLIHEISPYLLQHAHNPVDWFPWCPEAFQLAKVQDKPVFLSVGYSTCYWCHVMERESFENREIAAILNEHFVCVKVDREERPDIDEQYMLAGELVIGRGGWPNSVWLTPEGKPWMAGTYFPPEQFKKLLVAMAQIWKTRREDVERQGENLTAAVRDAFSGDSGSRNRRPLDRQLVERAISEARESFDSSHGGFGGAPKFPPHDRLLLLADEYRRGGDKSLLNVLTATLDAMARGGIHDQLGGGFHRYATDRQWLLPHFEKMLYDNAQLLRVYADAFLLTGEPAYREVADNIVAWVDREMTDPSGAFYCALDAESDGEEGKYYVWTYAEVLEILGKSQGELFAGVYGVRGDGNYVEQATGVRPGTNVLHLPQPPDQFARQNGLDPAKLKSDLRSMREKILAARAKRNAPRRDDKILAGWNGLMIGSLAYAGRFLNEPRYIQAAAKAADFILTQMTDGGRLLRSYRAGRAQLPAYLDDYAFLARGLLDLHEATGQQHWLDRAVRFADIMLDEFQDKEHGGFFFTATAHESLLVRSKNPMGGGNIPSGNAVAAESLWRLGELLGKDAYRQAADRALAAFSDIMWRMPQAAESLILVLAKM
jgi:uncharacterized protein